MKYYTKIHLIHKYTFDFLPFLAGVAISSLPSTNSSSELRICDVSCTFREPLLLVLVFLEAKISRLETFCDCDFLPLLLPPMSSSTAESSLPSLSFFDFCLPLLAFESFLSDNESSAVLLSFPPSVAAHFPLFLFGVGISSSGSGKLFLALPLLRPDFVTCSSCSPLFVESLVTFRDVSLVVEAV